MKRVTWLHGQFHFVKIHRTEHFHQILNLCTFLYAYSTLIQSFKKETQEINLMLYMDPDFNKQNFFKPLIFNAMKCYLGFALK